jgi:tRNA pseudouridine32 synthase/23S rRNA pseudouridine746 synthase
VLRAAEVPGEPNAESRIDLVARAGDHGLYRLQPHTGRTHQLRLHMARLGVPIVGDAFYPCFRDVAEDDYRDPLQLLAQAVELTDPFTGRARRFVSRRTLAAWPSDVPEP